MQRTQLGESDSWGFLTWILHFEWCLEQVCFKGKIDRSCWSNALLKWTTPSSQRKVSCLASFDTVFRSDLSASNRACFEIETWHQTCWEVLGVLNSTRGVSSTVASKSNWFMILGVLVTSLNCPFLSSFPTSWCANSCTGTQAFFTILSRGLIPLLFCFLVQAQHTHTTQH